MTIAGLKRKNQTAERTHKHMVYMFPRKEEGHLQANTTLLEVLSPCIQRPKNALRVQNIIKKEKEKLMAPINSTQNTAAKFLGFIAEGKPS